MSDKSSEQPGVITHAIQAYCATKDRASFDVLFKHYQDTVSAWAEWQLRNTRGVMDHEDVANSVLRQLAEGIENENSWFVDGATNRDTLLKLLGRLTFLRCRKIVRYERAGIRARIVRDADLENPSEISRSETLPDIQSGWDVDYKLTLAEIEQGLRQLDSGRPDEVIQVFRCLLVGQTIRETAQSLDLSERTIERIRQMIRTFVKESVEGKQKLDDYDTMQGT